MIADYQISDDEFKRFNNQPIFFENVPVEETVASGAGKLEIQRSEGQGHGDIVMAPKGTEVRIHLGEELFRRINERMDDLFLDGNLI